MPPEIVVAVIDNGTALNYNQGSRTVPFNVTIPTYGPNTPRVQKNPLVLFYADRFIRPYPFQADIIVGIDKVFDQKVDAIVNLESQLFETVYADDETQKKRLAAMPKDAAGRRKVAYTRHSSRDSKIADKYREALAKWYPADQAKKIKHAEAFEICEYGRQPSTKEIKRLFPFLPK